ncbi:Na+/H+ antiporter NhaA [Salinispira pacifica]
MTYEQENRLPRTPIRKILYPFERFLRIEASGGILLIVATAAALIWANVPGGEASYEQFWHTAGGVSFGGYALNLPLSHWINDSLMGVFFFVVGLEIKREMLVGELSSAKRAALPIAAAAGGMAVPALIYVLFNSSGAAAGGWGIPMATDIAFAIGVMALLGKRVPLSLKVFVTALAIVDDLGAVLVIAIFYTGSINYVALAAAALMLLIMLVLNWLGVRAAGVYLVFGIGMWLALLDSGLHASLAGILAALAIPAKRHINGREFLVHSRHYLERFESQGLSGDSIVPNEAQENALSGLESALEAASSPMSRLEHALHPWVRYGVMPLFALANAGVSLLHLEEMGIGGSFLSLFGQPVSIGVMAGLFLGKPIGILLASWIAVRSGAGSLPRGVGWGDLAGAGILAGIGFTMSLFIADLAFDRGALLVEAKIGFLAASLLAGIAGSLVLLASGRGRRKQAAAASVGR